MPDRVGVMIRAASGPGVLHQLTGVIARRGGDITSVEIVGDEAGEATIDFEIDLSEPPETLVEELRALPIVREVGRVKTLQTIYGKRIIIMGGGAQVGQVAIGAISEADRHNIRGERISVDTIPLVGEQPLADAVRAVARLPRAKALVLAGSLMGGDIERAVREVREQGLLVVSLNMAGSVPEAQGVLIAERAVVGRLAGDGERRRGGKAFTGAVRTRPEGRYFESGGLRLHYVVHGRGEPLVLIHGYLSDLRRAWLQRGIFHRLAARYRVAALDCRGHGRSDKPTDPAAYGREMAWDVVRLLDHLDVGAAHLVGYSMGAHMIAQLLTLVPERILTATMAGAAGRVGWTDADDELAELEARELEAGSLRSQILRLTPAGQPPPTDAEIRALSRAALRGQDLAALAAVRRANRGEVVSEEALARVRLPVLGVVGSLDPYVARFRRLQRTMPDFRLTVVEGGTHRTTAGRPEFLTAVESFLSEHPTSR